MTIQPLTAQPAALPWDTAASRAITGYMGLATRRTWVSHKTGAMAGFGGCLAVVFLFPLVIAYLMLKVGLWLFAEAVLIAALACVWVAGGSWRAYRALRHNPEGAVRAQG